MSGQSAKLEDWIGNKETSHDVAGAGPVTGLAATFDRAEDPPKAGDPIPPGWHWLYFLPYPRRSLIGADGLPDSGEFLPPVPLPRRMFAGGRMRFGPPLRVGEEIRCESEIVAVNEKTGRSGRLVFVTARYRVLGAAGLAVEDEQDIVYREESRGDEKPAPGVAAEIRSDDWHRAITPDSVMLFRFSALTFNGHRIHYDRPYATGVEGYPGLVVHGPLSALLLLELCRDNAPGRRLESFDFQARRPIFDTAPFRLTGRLEDGGRECRLAAVDSEGFLAMTARVRFVGD